MLFATTDPAEILRLVAAVCMSSLGSPLENVIAYRRGVGVVVGVQLRDGRRVAIKVHRQELVPHGLDGIRAIQMHLADAGMPAPHPLGDVAAIGRGLASPEEWLHGGTAPDAHDPVIRGEMVRQLRRFIASATPMVLEVALPVMHPYGLPPEQLWPTPHDLRFDLTLDGGEWIDEIGAAARRKLDATPLPGGVGHVDWRSENLRFDGASLVAILDWDSVACGPEAAIIGANASAFTADWGRPETNPIPRRTRSRRSWPSTRLAAEHHSWARSASSSRRRSCIGWLTPQDVNTQTAIWGSSAISDLTPDTEPS